jgi:hypothetical protein
VLTGNTADNTTLGDFLDRIEKRYAHRIWVMDRGAGQASAAGKTIS